MVAETLARIDGIAHLYEFRGADEVRSCLKRRKFLFDLLEETQPHIARIFGQHATGVFLERQYDTEDRRESVCIKIQVDLDLESGRLFLQRFDREWWLEAYDPFFGEIQAMLEFRPIVRT